MRQWPRGSGAALVMKALRSISLIVLGVAIGLPAGVVVGSRSRQKPTENPGVGLNPAGGLRSLDGAIAQWQREEREEASRTNAIPAGTNPRPIAK